MKISIDISSIIYGTGVSVYLTNLVGNLLKIDNKNNYLLGGYSFRRFGELEVYCENLKGNFQKKFIKLPPTFFEYLWNKYHIVTYERVIGRCDVYHSSDWTQAPSGAFKITTVHDLIPVLYPQFSLPSIITVQKRRLEWVKKEVDRIIVPSKQTLTDLITLGFNKNIISVIPEAPDDEIIPADKDEIARVKHKLGVKTDYFLAIGITPRKNIDRIIKAYKKITKQEKLSLVIVGEPKINVAGVKGVVFTNFIHNNDLGPLLSGAIGLIYPSLYEGFGLPILEAMKCNTPVLTSNFGAMKEVAEDKCTLVDPYSIESIEKGMEKIINEGKRNDFSKILAKYSWETTAKKTLSIYQSKNN